MRSIPRRILQLAAATGLLTAAIPASPQEVVILGGIEQVQSFLVAEDWWGEATHGESRQVPRIIMTGIDSAWRGMAQELTVADKKEYFYRMMLPLIVHANELVLERRATVIALRDALAAGRALSAEEQATLQRAFDLMRVDDSDDVAARIDEVLYKLDEIPVGLALGQAAYESGYGTSRFAVEGNALFGQWVFGGEGMVPTEQRQNLGDHRIASYDWPFDSVRGYFINLMSHPAYAEFRELRAEFRARGEPLDSLRLADGLISYSERGQEYVDTLKGMIRVNGLDVADGAQFRDEPLRFVIGVTDEPTAAAMRQDIEEMRASGELARIVERMRLD